MMKRILLSSTAGAGLAIAAVLAAFVAPRAALAQDDSSALLTPGAKVKIPGGGKFDFLEVDSVHHRLLAAHEKNGTAAFIDLNTNKLIKVVPTDCPPVHIVLDPDNGRYFISGSDDKKVVVLNADDFSTVGVVEMPAETDAILLDPKANRIFVTNDEGSHVWGIDPNSLKVVATIDIPGSPEYMLYDASADKIYLNLKSTSQLATIDPNSGQVASTWSVAPADKPHGLCFDKDTGRLFSVGANGKLVAIDVSTGKVTASADVAAGVDQNAFDPSTKRIYCASGGRMSVVQETDDGLKFLGNVKTFDTAKNVAVDPVTHAVWTCYTDGKNSYAQSYTP
jgi:DNA-binding beta-propeller fold protein YncE